MIPLSIVAVALAACGSDGGTVSVDGAWARTSAAGQGNGAVYFELTVSEDDTLVGASVPASVAVQAEVHEVVMADGADAMDDGGEMDDLAMSEGSDDMDDSMDARGDGHDGAMTMREIEDGLPLSAGETVTFEPGGYHVMLLELADPLETGDEFEVTLQLAEAGATTVVVEVAESAP